MTPSHHARADALAGVLSVLVALLGLAVLLGGLLPRGAERPSYVALPLCAALAYGATGAVLARAGRAPAVRRVLVAIGLAQAVVLATTLYAAAGLAGPHAWPGTSWAAWLGSWLWAPAYLGVGVVLPLLLPDGRPRWRGSGWLAAAALLWTAATWALTPYDLQDVPRTDGLVNPVGTAVAASPVVVAAGVALLGLALAVAVATVAARWRTADGPAREQLTWPALGLAATALLAAAAFAAPQAAGEVLSGLAMLPFPLSLGVALVRARLWDVELVLSRSLLYGLLTGLVVGGYVLAVALLGSLAGARTGAPVLATAGVALVVLPLHRRLQTAVNRLVHGDAEDPLTALARLGDRLEASAAPGEVAASVLPALVAQVSRALRVPYAALELADGTTTGTGTGQPPADAVRVPLEHLGGPVGRLVVGGAPVRRAERRLLGHLARQASVAVHAVLLERDAQRARAQAVAAREEERRRLRRDLHDGLGPALAAAALQVETAQDLLDRDPAAARALLARLAPRLNGAVGDVRAIVHDLRPPTLDELGLAGALVELAQRFAGPDRGVSVHAEALPPLPAAVDLAAYRIASEALSNAARHSGARRVELQVQVTASALDLRVVDDGGGLPAAPVAGVGLRSMRERAEELGGTCAVGSGPAGGTCVHAVLPLVPDLPLPRPPVPAAGLLSARS